MLHNPEPWNLVANGYAATTSKVFQGYAKAAIALTQIHSDSHLLDIACGPGTLPLLAYKQCKSIKAIDFSERMLALFQQQIEHASIANIELECGDAQQLPYADASFDAAFSMFGLMFFPDRHKAYAEILRTLKPGGELVVSSWAPVADSPAMQVMFGAVRVLNPDIPAPQTVIDSLENPDFFKDELAQAGFQQVTVHRHTEKYAIESIDGLWRELVAGSAPIAMLKSAMPVAAWKEKEAAALGFLADALPSLPTTLGSDAWLAHAVK